MVSVACTAVRLEGGMNAPSAHPRRLCCATSRTSTMAQPSDHAKRLHPDRDQLEIFVEALLRYAESGDLSFRSFFEAGDKPPLNIVPFKLNGSGLVGVIDVAMKVAEIAANHAEPAV